MRGPLSFDDVEELEFTARTPDAHRAAAATLTAWAEEQHPDDDDVTPASLLAAAAWHLDVVGDRAGALDLYRRASAAPGEAPPDIRCYLHGALLKVGDRDEARRVADDVRRSAPSDPDVYLFMAENHELDGDLQQAHRWLAMGVNRLDLRTGVDPPLDFRLIILLRARRRVRQALGFPPDDIDLIVPEPRPGDDELD